MTLHRDHIVGLALLALAALAFALSTDLPIGTLGSPGAGMLPMIAIALIAVFSVALLAGAGNSPVAASLSWDELPHAACVVIAAAVATALYTVAGFWVSMALMIFGLLVVVERAPLLPSAAYAVGLPAGVKLLLGTLLKSPLPNGPWGF